MDWSYIAGYFDGEGTVGFHRSKTGRMTSGLHWHNTHLESLRAMRAFMGCGHLLVRKQRARQNHPVGVLSITRKSELLRVIDAMLPHLIIKKDAAERLRAHLVENVNDRRSANRGKLAAMPTECLVTMHFAEGLSLSEIARLIGVHPSAVSQLFKRRGIAPRPKDDGRLKGRPKSAETRARMKASRQKLWADPAFRAAQLTNLGRARSGVNITSFTFNEPGA